MTLLTTLWINLEPQCSAQGFIGHKTKTKPEKRRDEWEDRFDQIAAVQDAIAADEAAKALKAAKELQAGFEAMQAAETRLVSMIAELRASLRREEMAEAWRIAERIEAEMMDEEEAELLLLWI